MNNEPRKGPSNEIINCDNTLDAIVKCIVIEKYIFMSQTVRSATIVLVVLCAIAIRSVSRLIIAQKDYDKGKCPFDSHNS